MADADTDAKPVDQDTLVADIDRTRTELARTIDAIADRVSPKKNVARTMEQIRQRTDRAMEQVRQGAGQIDPLVAGAAAAAVAISITALFLWRRSRR
jgi:methyl-accepting chemotaxis protein